MTWPTSRLRPPEPFTSIWWPPDRRRGSTDRYPGAATDSSGCRRPAIRIVTALFAFMVAVGSMNIVWMVLITVVLSLERTVAWGRRLATGIGVVAAVAGVVLISVTVV